MSDPDDGSEREPSPAAADAGADGERTQRLRHEREFLEDVQEVAKVGGWEFDQRTETFRVTETASRLVGLPQDADFTVETVVEHYHPDDREKAFGAFERVMHDEESQDVELRRVTGVDDVRWLRVRGEPWYSDGDTHVGARGVVQDITERKRREAQLERRERTLQELHKTTQDLLGVQVKSDVADCLVNHLLAVFEFEHVAVFRFNEDEGVLHTVATSVAFEDELAAPKVVEPGDHPLWEVYRRGERRVFDDGEWRVSTTDGDDAAPRTLVEPIGDYGLVVVVETNGEDLSDSIIQLLEVLTANAEAFLARMSHEEELYDALVQISKQESQRRELERVIESIRMIQQRATNGGSRDALETAVCDGLVATDPIEFAWIGRPEGDGTDLTASAWAGSRRDYLDVVTPQDAERQLPSIRAATNREAVTISNVAAHVQEGQWAKEALSRQFKSVMSVPLVYDDVLYGVVTAYGRRRDTFAELYGNILVDAGTLLVHYINILEERQFASANEYRELEFSVSDPKYPLHALAERTDSTVRFDTIAETGEEAVRVLVTILDGDAERVLEQASSITSIREATWFGNAENKQLNLTISRPFLASTVTKHVGRLVESISGDGTTKLFVKVPAGVSSRPLVEAISAEYSDVELLAKRTRTDSGIRDNALLGDLLTERQYEILKAAYYGGYFDSPRGVTAQELADSFDISSPVVYNHMQAAHRTVLERVFDTQPPGDLDE